MLVPNIFTSDRNFGLLDICQWGGELKKKETINRKDKASHDIILQYP
jgi:hypothetical protein